MPRIVRTLALLGLVLAVGRAASADAIVVTRAMRATTICQVQVEEGRVVTELEIGLRDLRAFQNVLPNALLEKMGIDAEPLAQRLPVFFEKDWLVVADGQPVPGRVTALEVRPRVRRDEITGEPLPVVEGQEENVLFLVLEHVFEGRPKVLSFAPPRGEGARFPSAEIGFVTWHRGVPVIDFLYLPGEVTLDLDWDDPWFSRFRMRNLKRRYDAPLSVFLYVDAFEVRKEVIARPKDLQHWVDLGLEGASVIPVDAQGRIKEAVGAFLKDRGTVEVDGRTIEPILDRIHFVRRTLRTTGVIDPPEEMSVDSAQLGIIFAYPVAELPKRATLTWDLWSPRIQKVPAMATDEVGGMPSTLTVEDPVLEWENFLKNPTVPTFAEVAAPPSPSPVPLLSIVVLAVGLLLAWRWKARRVPVLVAAVAVAVLTVFVPLPFTSPTALSDEDAAPVLQDLLRNVYRAFDFRSEGDIYDALARSVDGDLLTKTYLETKRALVLENQGGARARVQGVEVESAAARGPEEGEGFTARCTWTVAGSVGHWGHIHQRRNRYVADLTVRPRDGAWRITDLVLMEEERL